MTDAELDELLARLDDKARHDGYQLASAAAQSSYPEVVERCAKGTDWYVAAAALRQLRADAEALRLAALAVQEVAILALTKIAEPITLGDCIKAVNDLHLDPLTEGRKYREQVRRDVIPPALDVCKIIASTGGAAADCVEALRALADKPQEPTT